MGSSLPFVSLIHKPCQGVINMKHMTVGGGVGDTSRACPNAGEQQNQFWGAAPVCWSFSTPFTCRGVSPTLLGKDPTGLGSVWQRGLSGRNLAFLEVTPGQNPCRSGSGIGVFASESCWTFYF